MTELDELWVDDKDIQSLWWLAQHWDPFVKVLARWSDGSYSPEFYTTPGPEWMKLC